MDKKATSSLYDLGLEIRGNVLGSEYVDDTISQSNDFTQPFQSMLTEWCWGYIWSREGLSLGQRSLLNLGILTALGKTNELSMHVRGALKNGLTVLEIREALLQATVYCGIPAGLEAFKVANEILEQER